MEENRATGSYRDQISLLQPLKRLFTGPVGQGLTPGLRHGEWQGHVWTAACCSAVRERQWDGGGCSPEEETTGGGSQSTDTAPHPWM